MSNNLLPWSEKYRPNNIDNIIYHEKIVSSITKYLDNKNLPHLLFYGPPGTGKTSTILTIAKKYYNEDFHDMIMVLNASEERGIETVRNRIKQFVTTIGYTENKNTPKFKLIILDEIDAMTDDAQAILRKVVEKYVNNVRFCFICNYLKKINPAIQSRCIMFRFKPIPDENMFNFINLITKKEKLKLNANAKNLIIDKSNGDMRKLLNILQSIYMYSTFNKNKIINENDIAKILSCPTNECITKIILFIQNNNLKNSIEFITKIIIDYGISLNELITCIYEKINNHIICKDDNIKYSNEKCCQIIKNITIINENLTSCNSDNIQLISFISIFYL